MQKLFTLIVLFCGWMFPSCSDDAGNIKKFASEASAADANSSLSMPLEPGQYVQWIQDIKNGLKKEKTIEDITFSVQYKPSEYIACMEQKKDELADSTVKKIVSEISDMQYYDLKIELKDGQGEFLKYKLASSNEDYEKRVKYCAFDMQKDIKLLAGNDSMPCTLFHFERAYDLAPYGIFLLGFPLSKIGSDKEAAIVIQDKLFNKGILKFTFSESELKNLPKLKTL